MCHPSWGRALTEAQHRRDLTRLRGVRDRIDREYAQPLNVEALARSVDVPAGQLSRQFRRAYGESPYAYLVRRRIERAKALLRCGELGVTEVCFAVGFPTLGIFRARFTELCGVPPRAYMPLPTRAATGMTPRVPEQATKQTAKQTAKQATKPVRNQEASATGPELACSP